MATKILSSISIIIPVYNAAPFLDRLIQSILNQTYPCHLCVFVDDGSQDDSLRILNAYAANYSWIRVIMQEHFGVSRARNTAIQSLPDDGYSVLIDADDYIEDNYLEYFAAKIGDSDACMMRWDSKEYTGTSKDIFVALNNWEIARGPTKKLINNRILKSVKFDESLSTSEDILWNYEISARCSTVAFVPYQSIYNVCENPCSLTRKGGGELFNRRLLDSFAGWQKSYLFLKESLSPDLFAVIYKGLVGNLVDSFFELVGGLETHTTQYGKTRYQNYCIWFRESKIIKNYCPRNNRERGKKLLIRFPNIYRFVRKLFGRYQEKVNW